MRLSGLETTREYYRLWRLVFPGKVRAYQRRYNQTEKGRARQRRFDQSEKGRGCNQRANKSEKGRASRRRFDQSEKGQACARRAWRSEKGRARRTRRRARKRDALVPGAEAAIAVIEERANWLRSQGWDVEVDHIYPLGFGWHEPANLQIIFASENAAKNCSFDYRPSVVF